MIDNHIPGYGSLRYEINLLLDQVDSVIRKRHIDTRDLIKLENLSHQIRYRANKELNDKVNNS